MKKFLAATVIFMSSCTAYADYATTKHCSNVGNLVAQMRGQVVYGKMTEQEIVDKLIMQGEPLNNTNSVLLASFAATGNEMYTEGKDWYMAGGEVCLKLMRTATRYGFTNPAVMIEARHYFNGKVWK